ncbi:hypothetical protein [Nostocoides sp.]|jgi:uncharacterized membrane protein|uniref:hypothetical protein n=1 Tax=Nostocoides sp. TaxID=1917966 RepID=UPI003BB1165A
MEGELKDYRQPMVTSLGILLGFLLNFLAGWASEDEAAIQDSADVVILGTIAFAVTIMLGVLFRILNGRARPDDHATYYRRTLHLYVVGVSLAFMGFWLAVLL